MARKNISVGVKIDGNAKGFKSASKEAEAAAQKLNSKVKKGNRGLKASFMQLRNAIASAYAVKKILDFGKALVNLYKIQEENETKLLTVMKQRMGANEADLKHIKSLTGAYQQMGVVGDEVQIAGLQQLATFLKQKDSLNVLLPAMNNLIAQQKGYSSTTGDAVNIANLMGRALTGQIGSLTRVGITFNAAQADLIKYGTESEKAAALAEILTDNVGEMNAELGATDFGKQTQLNNNLGDLKENLGAVLTGTNLWSSALDDLNKRVIDLNSTLEDIKVVQDSEVWEENATGWQKFVMWASKFTEKGREAIKILSDGLEDIENKKKDISEEPLIVPEEIETAASIKVKLKDIAEEIENTALADHARLKELYEQERVLKNQLKILEDIKEAAYDTTLRAKSGSTDKLTGLGGLPSFGAAPSTDTLRQMDKSPIEEMTVDGMYFVDTLTSAFEGFFQQTEGGFEAMAQSFGRALQQMAAQFAARAVMFAILTALSGGTGAIANFAKSITDLGAGNFFFGGGGMASTGGTSASISPVRSTQNIQVQGMISGRDLALINRRNA